MIKIFIADDHLIVREGLRRIIEANESMIVCGEVDNGESLLDAMAGLGVDVLILDVSMQGPGLLEILRRLERHYPTIKTLVLSAHAEEQYAKRSLKAGAQGYLTKNHSPEELITAITKIAAGGKFISETLAQILALDINKPEPELLHESLSQREHQVMCLLGSGKSIGDIAKDLSLSPKTVSTYRSRVLEKLVLKNNAELTHYVIENHLDKKA